jgi:hypothetical protein
VELTTSYIDVATLLSMLASLFHLDVYPLWCLFEGRKECMGNNAETIVFEGTC